MTIHILNLWKTFRIPLLGFLFLFYALPVRSGEGLFWAGLRAQGFVDFEPGNDWMNGVELGYSNYNILRHQLEFQGAYLTSRPEAAFRNVLKSDWYLFSPLWHFRRKEWFDPTFQVDMGYFHYDYESELFKDLQNTTWTLGCKTGVAFNFGGGRYALRYAVGYQFASEASSLIYPIPFSLVFSALID